MVRRHGWQLPAHKFQVIAITIFFLLVIVFYAFFAPFLGSHVLEYVSVCLYTPVALAVFILYVRCTAINPADPGLISRQNGSRRLDSNTELPNNLVRNRIQTSPSEVSRSSMGSTVNQKASMDKDGTQDLPLDSPNSKTTSCLSAVLCAVFVKEDCKKSEPSGEEALFCILCNVEVQKFSKHCRSCDKCVDGFDHHCRWLNNCVGRKNYMSFISLMAISLIWLAIQLGVGIAVFVRIFVDRKETEVLIIDKLGNVFSRAPFATIVAISCAVSLLACVPLGELFFFHIILMKKGITTYEYVVAMRAMSEGPAQSIEEEIGNAAHSPSGSATTGFSVGSSLALSYKGGWCTPPRVFIDDQDEIIPHLDPGMVPSTIDPDVAGSSGNKLPKRPVRISAWKLAKLNSVEAIRAGAKARASSSVLRPIDTHRVQDSDLLSNVSSVSVDIVSNRERNSDSRASPVRNSYPASHASKDDQELGMMSMSSLSSPSHIQEHVSLSPLPPEHSSVPYNVPVSTSHWNHFLPDRHVSSKGYFPSMSHNNPIFQTRSRYDGDRIVESSRTSELPVTATQPTSVFKEAKRSVVWDQEAGRYVSVPVTSRIETPPSSQKPSGKPPSETNYCNRRHIPTVPIPSTSSKPSTQKHENLTYTEQSIFFGGPLLSIPPRSEGNNPPRSGPESRPTFTRSFLTNPPPDSK